MGGPSGGLSEVHRGSIGVSVWGSVRRSIGRSVRGPSGFCQESMRVSQKFVSNPVMIVTFQPAHLVQGSIQLQKNQALKYCWHLNKFFEKVSPSELESCLNELSKFGELSQ